MCLSDRPNPVRKSMRWNSFHPLKQTFVETSTWKNPLRNFNKLSSRRACGRSEFIVVALILLPHASEFIVVALILLSHASEFIVVALILLPHACFSSINSHLKQNYKQEMNMAYRRAWSSICVRAPAIRHLMLWFRWFSLMEHLLFPTKVYFGKY